MARRSVGLRPSGACVMMVVVMVRWWLRCDVDGVTRLCHAMNLNVRLDVFVHARARARAITQMTDDANCDEYRTGRTTRRRMFSSLFFALAFLQYHWEEPAAVNTTEGIASLFAAPGGVDVVMHPGDLSYATGYESEWDRFVEQLQPIAAAAPYMTGQGNVRVVVVVVVVVVVDVVVVVVVVTFPARVSSKRWHHYRWCVCVSGGVARLPGLVFAL